MWLLLMAHQQESFLPFSSRQSLSCCLSCVAKRSTPKPRGPLPFPSELHGPPIHSRTVWPPIYFRTAWSSLYFGAVWFTLSMAAGPRFKSQCPSSFAAPFLTPPTVSYTCQHPRILPALLSCHCKSGQVWPHGMEPIISKLSAGPVTRGSCLLVPS